VASLLMEAGRIVRAVAGIHLHSAQWFPGRWRKATRRINDWHTNCHKKGIRKKAMKIKTRIKAGPTAVE
jgi:hypothetical protein